MLISCRISKSRINEKKYCLVMDYFRKKEIPFAVGTNSWDEDTITANLTGKQFCKLYKKYGKEIGTIIL